MTISFNGYFLRLLYGIGSGCLAAFKPRFRPGKIPKKKYAVAGVPGLPKYPPVKRKAEFDKAYLFSPGIFGYQL
jgi:hypothetical protein